MNKDTRIWLNALIETQKKELIILPPEVDVYVLGVLCSSYDDVYKPVVERALNSVTKREHKDTGDVCLLRSSLLYRGQSGIPRTYYLSFAKSSYSSASIDYMYEHVETVSELLTKMRND